MPDIRQLLRAAYTCAACPQSFGFVPSPNRSYFKFPPIIGARGKADILFVGINPRRSPSNLALHEQLMTSKQAFSDLSANRFAGQPYISAANGEVHYLPHLEIIRQVFGSPRPFGIVRNRDRVIFVCLGKFQKPAAAGKSLRQPVSSQRHGLRST